MQIASQVYGIKTAANGLCFTPKGRIVYITKRFDVLPDRTKLLMEDFASVIGRNEKQDGKDFK
jgi:serine/threonine-protein kinase HipA